MRKRKKLSTLEKSRILGFLMDRMENGKLPWGAQAEAARKFSIYKSTISALWARYKKACKSGGSMPIGCLTCGRRNNGRPIFYDREELLGETRVLPITQCTSVWGIASNIGVAPCTVARIIRDENLIVWHENKINPALTDENCFARIEY